MRTDGNVSLLLGETTFSFRIPNGATFGTEYAPFQTDKGETPNSCFDVTLREPALPAIPSDFSWASQAWRFRSGTPGHALEVFDHSQGQWRCTAVSNLDFSHGTVFPWDLMAGEPSSCVTQYPTDRVMMVNRLAYCRALVVHASAVRVGGAVLLFCGRSGIGKSTMADLWTESGRGTLLNDDRALVFFRGDEPWAGAAPWHGKNPAVDARPGPLGGIFHLAQADNNRLMACEPVLAAARLLATSATPFYNKDAAGLCSDTAVAATALAPSYELAFRPTPDTVEFLLEAGVVGACPER